MIKTSLTELLGKEVYGVFKQKDTIITVEKSKIRNIAFSKDKVLIKTDLCQMFIEDMCHDLEQVKARVKFYEKSLSDIVKPNIIMPKDVKTK